MNDPYFEQKNNYKECNQTYVYIPSLEIYIGINQNINFNTFLKIKSSIFPSYAKLIISFKKSSKFLITKYLHFLLIISSAYLS